MHKARGLTSGPVVRSGGVTGVALPQASAIVACYRTPISQLPGHTMAGSQSGLNVLQQAQMPPLCSGPGLIPRNVFQGSPQMGLVCGGVQSGSLMGTPVANPFLSGAGLAPSRFFGGNQPAGGAQVGGSILQVGAGEGPPQLVSSSGSGAIVNTANNPFLS